MAASPPVLRFPISPWWRYGDPGSIPVSGEAGWATPGLPDTSTVELSWCWAAFQVSSDKPPKKAGARRKTGNPQIQTNTEEKKKKNKIWFLVFGLKC